MTKSKLALPLVVLVVFTVFSLWVVGQDGPLGFLGLAAREPWGLQMLLDLFIALWLFVGWMVRDARSRGIASWPYVVLTVALGSIGALAYLVHRGLKARSPEPSAARA